MERREQGMNRRTSLKAAVASGAVLVAGGALAGCAANGGGTSAAASGDAERVVGTAPVSFAEETDVLILGTGIAGMSAAMDPVEAGHKVMLVDKLERAGALFYDGGWQATEAGLKVAADATCAARA